MKKKLLLIPLVLLLAISLVVIGCEENGAPPPEGCEELEAELAACEAALAACEAPAEVYEWDMTYPMYRGTWDWDVVVRWCDDLRVASGGRLDITPYAGGEIVPAWTEFDAVSTGTLQIGIDYGPYLLGYTPMAIYASGLPPFTLPRWEHYKVLYYELGLEELLREAFAEYNIYYVATMPTNNCVMLSQIPVTTAADFADLDIRAAGGIYGELAAAAGAGVVSLPWAEIYGALDTGMINSCIAGPLSSQVDAGFHEQCSYFLETPISPVDSWCLLINLDAWNELPADLQMLFNESASYLADIFTASYFVHDLWARETIVDMGYTITTLPVEEQAIMAGYSLAILDEFAAEDPIFAEATEILKDYMRELGLLD